MGQEIERKFLVSGSQWQDAVCRKIDYQQGYLTRGKGVSVRIRIGDGKARLNIKSATLGIVRKEFEYPIPLEDAETMLDELCGDKTIEKVRHYVEYQGHTWEIDVFKGANDGLIVAELELNSENEVFALPEWVGEEVSEDSRYFNVALIDNPYCQWHSKDQTL